MTGRDREAAFWQSHGDTPVGEVVQTPLCMDRPRREGDDECSGSTEWRESLSGTGTPMPRCDRHHSKRLDVQDGINRRYAPFSDVPPRGFDPSYAGEHWDSDY